MCFVLYSNFQIHISNFMEYWEGDVTCFVMGSLYFAIATSHIFNIYANYNWVYYDILGYFTHVTTLAEVKEQVLKYIPVMARPMVMYREKHPIQWTGVYADIEVSVVNYLLSLGWLYF